MVGELREAVAYLPSYGCRRAWGVLRRQREARQGLAIKLNQVYRIMHGQGLLLARKSVQPRPQRRHEGRAAVDASNQRGFKFRFDNGEPVGAKFALDCCNREAMSRAAATVVRTGDIMRDVMLAADGASVRAIIPQESHRMALCRPHIPIVADWHLAKAGSAVAQRLHKRNKIFAKRGVRSSAQAVLEYNVLYTKQTV